KGPLPKKVAVLLCLNLKRFIYNKSTAREGRNKEIKEARERDPERVKLMLKIRRSSFSERQTRKRSSRADGSCGFPL
ncbi:hypothetical protein, partial [Jeotgalibacillus soli]|uniref:hypothetical protein n=1 Tax=Jeotgalibacillus soli TaxID=889306 RepID=UPI000596C024